jgi:hypothetical protein
MYNSGHLTTINHLHCSFGRAPGKRTLSLVHGTDFVGNVSASDPTIGKLDNWGMSDPLGFAQFSDRYIGDAMWGLGSGEIVGNPNVMDVSQPYGMLCGQGLPGGFLYYLPIDELRGRFLQATMWSGGSRFNSQVEDNVASMPRVPSLDEALCSVWIAKSSSIPSLTEGMIGIMSGSSQGVVSAYSLGYPGMRSKNVVRGEPTARWVLSPGVPIVALKVDESYSPKRQAQNRIWAVALNALGEIFYLTKFPNRPAIASRPSFTFKDEGNEKLAWVTGRSVHWNLVEPSRRVASPDPYGTAAVDGSYSPRSSWDGECLSEEQIKAETKEIENFFGLRPKEFRNRCVGWDMRRRLEVDFAGDDANLAGESAIVFNCGLDEDSSASVKRFVRCRSFGLPHFSHSGVSTPKAEPVPEAIDSVFGQSSYSTIGSSADPSNVRYDAPESPTEQSNLSEEWRMSNFMLGTAKSVQILATALDISTFATMTLSEDPLVTIGAGSDTSSGSSSPVGSEAIDQDPSRIPGQRARFVAAGTSTGVVFVWDVRASIPRSSQSSQHIEPVRVIYTESPEISCLGLTGLYLVHGGNDGLVQAWDPLASTLDPIRTLNSRFSSRARRRLVQAQASAQGVGINLFAAGAIALDPEPDVLRGIVSLGSHIRYWSYRSNDMDGLGTRRAKRRARKSSRGSNSNSSTPRLMMRNARLQSFIEDEWRDMKAEESRTNRERSRLMNRFGAGWLGEEEEMRLAMVLSEETFDRESRGQSEFGTPKLEQQKAPEHFGDDDVAEAIRRSLEDSNSSSPTWNDPVSVSRQGSKSPGSGSRSPKDVAGPSNAREMEDLELALALSMADQDGVESARSADGDFPDISAGDGWGRGKRRA